MQELIYYVDENDKPTGETAPKLEAHNADTRLHAAFSCYIINDKGKFLVTQRALSKKVWPGVWTNSVCGHPFPNESREEAIIRRTQYELGMSVKVLQVVLPNYIYKTPPFNGIVEHEYCPVFFARAATMPNPNPEEVEEYKWMAWSEFISAAENDEADIWSWWCKDQLKQLKDNKLFNSLITKV
ncbi:MAG: geranylgeranyl diphosphate synthase, type [Patescibacteria group bacterium]|nr:geranylgeranyl diphosphate synthase, type [Patescibacteria group bacterium]